MTQQNSKRNLLAYQFPKGSLSRALLSIAIWAGCVVSTSFWGITSLLGTLLIRRESFSHFCMQQWARDNLWLCGAKIEVEGLEHLDGGGGYLFVANHTGILDILALVKVLPVVFKWTAKASLFKIPLLGWHMRNNGYIPVERSKSKSKESRGKFLECANRALSQGSSLVIFPEGTRSRDGSLGRFRSGAFVLAKDSRAPLIPVTIEGSWKVVRPTSLLVYCGQTIHVCIHPPLDSVRQDVTELQESARTVIKDELVRLRGSLCEKTQSIPLSLQSRV